MPLLLRVCLLAAVLVGGSTTLAAQESTLVYLVRHAEKATAERDTELSSAGWERAGALDAALRDAGIGAIVATERRRTQQTAEPLARRLAIDPELTSIADGAERNAAAVAEAIRSRHLGGVVLVVGHSNTVPAIIAALGGPAMPELCESAYSNLFVLRLGPDGTTSLARTRFGAADGPPEADCTP
jgi:broad specificity phosphatase PhoE